MGAPAFVPDSLLKEKRRRSTQFQLNVVLSDLIPLVRSLPDHRSAQCRALRYSPLLPRAAVVIVFHNEARSTLLRTVHSVINRSPTQLIRQIILVDDDSDVRK
jgi:polypeptide N-acetylgalactosaminyltransferase